MKHHFSCWNFENRGVIETININIEIKQHISQQVCTDFGSTSATLHLIVEFG